MTFRLSIPSSFLLMIFIFFLFPFFLLKVSLNYDYLIVHDCPLSERMHLPTVLFFQPFFIPGERFDLLKVQNGHLCHFHMSQNKFVENFLNSLFWGDAMMPRIHLVGNHILNRQAFKKQFNGSIVKASESIQNLYPITIRYKGAGSFHIHRKTMKELGAIAVLGIQ